MKWHINKSGNFKDYFYAHLENLLYLVIYAQFHYCPYFA